MVSASMKAVSMLVAAASLSEASVEQNDRTITQVVKLLQAMLDKSTKEGDEERKIYAKFKCYCDTSEAEKKASIKELTEQIALLESSIEESQGSNGGLSAECADLKQKMADNKDARETAKSVRNKENKAFLAEEADLEQAIKQMRAAIETLSKVGADQTASTGADNKQFMAGKSASLISLDSEVTTALRAATALMNPTQSAPVTAFLQAPFTGTYTSQSAQVMGIIKNMRDTFEKNLADARTTEEEAEKSYQTFKALKEEEYTEMDESYKKKQKELGGNDGDLASDRKSLDGAVKKKANDEEFLAKLLPMCEEKAKGYANRKILRTEEEAAIAEAISILNSDDAFATFGTADATKSGGLGGGLKFIQMHSAHGRIEDSRAAATQLLKSAASDAHSARLTKVASLLAADNPFETVLNEIDTMIEVIEEESKQDKENLDWCNKERKTNKAEKKQKNQQMLSLEKEIDKLDKRINDPKKGLKALIAETEASLLQNTESQKTETASRFEENVAYQKDIKNLVQAESILKRAIKALKTYYDGLEEKLAAGEAFLQEDPNPGEAWKGDGAYKGQSSKGGDVIDMLQFILKETVAEHDEAHKNEQSAQMDYEESMTDLKDKEAADQKLLAKTQSTLADTEEDLLQNQEDLKETTKDRDAIVDYLAKIKPGCDFITENFDLREKNRGTETKALNKAIRLIKGTPAYKTFEREATVESYGDCKAECTADTGPKHVKCLACRADVTIPAYCAGHKGTAGC